MSFFIEAEAPDLRDEQGRAIEAACAARGAWPVRFFPARRRRLRRPRAAVVIIPERLDDERELLADEASWDAEAWEMRPEHLPALADTIRVLGELLPQGFTLRATWVGSEVRHERTLEAGELADIALRSALNEFTRYVVPARRADG